MKKKRSFSRDANLIKLPTLYSSNDAEFDYSTEGEEWVTHIQSFCPFMIGALSVARCKSCRFWLPDGGARTSLKTGSNRYHIMGGEWEIDFSAFNHEDDDIHFDQVFADVYLGFMYDGEEFIEISPANVKHHWTPYMAGSAITSWCKISKYHKRFTLTQDDKTRRLSFKIPSIPVDTRKWFSDKPKWPIVWVALRSAGGKPFRARYRAAYTLAFKQCNTTAFTHTEYDATVEELHHDGMIHMKKNGIKAEETYVPQIKMEQ